MAHRDLKLGLEELPSTDACYVRRLFQIRPANVNRDQQACSCFICPERFEHA
jgi:hypothetical protein